MSEVRDSFDSAAEVLCDELRALTDMIPEKKKAGIQEIRLRIGKPLAFTRDRKSVV